MHVYPHAFSGAFILTAFEHEVLLGVAASAAVKLQVLVCGSTCPRTVTLTAAAASVQHKEVRDVSFLSTSVHLLTGYCIHLFMYVIIHLGYCIYRYIKLRAARDAAGA